MPSLASRPMLSLVLHATAVLWCGIMAGFFGTYSGNVALATQGLDGAMYAVVQSALNRHVRHALFFVFFFLPPAWCVLAAAAGWRERGAWRWCLLAAALLYTAGIIFFTREVNLPLNAYTESWNPQALPADWQRTRDAWKAANDLRSAVSATAFLLATVALAWRCASRAAVRPAAASG